MFSENGRNTSTQTLVSISPNTQIRLRELITLKLMGCVEFVALSDNSNAILDLIAQLEQMEKAVNQITHIQQRVSALESEILIPLRNLLDLN